MPAPMKVMNPKTRKKRMPKPSRTWRPPVRGEAATAPAGTPAAATARAAGCVRNADNPKAPQQLRRGHKALALSNRAEVLCHPDLKQRAVGPASADDQLASPL